jgi:hypothetical protein
MQRRSTSIINYSTEPVDPDRVDAVQLEVADILECNSIPRYPGVGSGGLRARLCQER